MVEAGRQEITTGGYYHNRILRFREERLKTTDMEFRTGGYENRVLSPTGRSVFTTGGFARKALPVSREDGRSREITTGGYESRILRFPFERTADGEVKTGGYNNKVHCVSGSTEHGFVRLLGSRDPCRFRVWCLRNLTTGGYEDEFITPTTGRHCVKEMRDGTVRGGGREEGTRIKCASDIIDDGGIESAWEKTSTDVTPFAVFVRKLTSFVSEILYCEFSIPRRTGFLFAGVLQTRWTETETGSCDGSMEFDHLMKILMVGDSGVGKSSLLIRFTSDTFADMSSPTIGVDFKLKMVKKGEKRVKLTLWDTAGQERFRTLTSSYYRGAQGIVLVYDVTRRQTFTNLSDVWLKEIERYSTKEDCIKMLVGNKLDLESERVVTKKEGVDFARRHGCLFLEASAKSSTNVKLCFDELVQKILETPSLSADTSALRQNLLRPGHPQESPATNRGSCSC